MMTSAIPLTVFTPTFNRAYCLHQVYESLLRQTNPNFKWLIIDDGSTDRTRELVQSWVNEGKVAIQYVYKENGGMHTGHNKAYALIETPFNVCIDSDDYMPDTAVETILKHLANLPPTCYGIVGLDANKDGTIIGTPIPTNLDYVTLNELYTLHGVTGDKKLVLRTEMVKSYPPYPTFPNERFVPLGHLYLLMDQDYSLKAVNEVFCIVEYQEDGSTKNILKQYKNNPNGFAFSRVSRINYGKNFKERFKNAIHLVSSSIFARNPKWLFRSDKPLLVLAALPLGCLLNLYIRYKLKS